MAEADFRARLQRLKRAIEGALVYGANEYANGNGRARPIVDHHFTTGNAERYNWPPLSAAYAARKAAGIVKTRGGGTFLDRGERRLPAHQQAELAKLRGASKLGPVPTIAFATKEGRAAGFGSLGSSASNLPMLVLFGDLRRAVNSRQHTVNLIAGGSVVRITFRGLPDHAKWLQEGTEHMAKRSPVEPNATDREEVIAAMRRFLDRALGRGGGAAASAQSNLPTAEARGRILPDG